jgi:CYTH domain-containing protein
MEIERKFLVNQLPCLKDVCSKKIVQAYLCENPVLRLRQMGDDFFICLKSKGELAREELEVAISKERFDTLWGKIEGTPVEKVRYFIPLENEFIAELDLYEGVLTGLTTVEVEFSSVEQANHFNPPTWFGKDVTYDNRFKNNQLAKLGLPPL